MAAAPIIKDKLFVFGAYEHLTRGVPTPITITAANAAALGLPASDLGSAPGVLHGQFVNARVDWNVDARNQVFFRYNYFRNQFPINTNSSGIATGLSALDAWSDFRDRAHVIGMQWVSYDFQQPAERVSLLLALSPEHPLQRSPVWSRDRSSWSPASLYSTAPTPPAIVSRKRSPTRMKT